MVYIYACVFLGFVPILCAGAGYGVVKLQNRRRRRLKIKQEELRNGDCKLPVDTMIVHEWLHANHKRVVKIKFGPDIAINVIGRKGEKLRTVNLKNVDSVVVEESLDVTAKKKPMILIHVPRDHDLVLELDSVGLKKKFLTKLELFLTSNKKSLICTQVNPNYSYFILILVSLVEFVDSSGNHAGESGDEAEAGEEIGAFLQRGIRLNFRFKTWRKTKKI